MNPLPTIKKHIRALDAAFDKIKSPETKKQAGGLIREAFIRYEGFCLPSLTVTEAPTIAPQSSETLGGVTVFPAVPESSVDGLLAAMQGDGVVASDEEPAVEGDLPGATGPFYPETVVAPAEQIGGWPCTAEVEIIGLAPNRRSLKAKLVQDGRPVSMERSLQNWKAADRVAGKLVRAGQYPMYRKVG